jgi:hypothetical protein
MFTYLCATLSAVVEGRIPMTLFDRALGCGLFLLASTAFARGAGAQIYQLDGKEFSSYSPPLAPITPGFVAGINRGHCGPLQFSGKAGLPSSAANHTFAVTLKKDGAKVEEVSRKMGSFFEAKYVDFSFAPVDFSPGEWTIEWAFLIDPPVSDKQSINLIAPIIFGNFGVATKTSCSATAMLQGSQPPT